MAKYFEWDEAKAQANHRKHGVSFKAATLVFDDPLCRTEQDRIEGGEYRWQTFGMVNGCLLLMVAHTVFFCDGEDGESGYELVRIISARPATKKERKRYENGQI